MYGLSIGSYIFDLLLDALLFWPIAYCCPYILQINNPAIVNAVANVEAQSSGFDASQTNFGGKH